MDIRINRFNVRYQGKIYGPGSVIYNVPEITGKDLVKESNGEMEELPLREETKEVTSQEETKKTPSQKVKESESTPGGEGGDPILSPVDPSKTVK